MKTLAVIRFLILLGAIVFFSASIPAAERAIESLKGKPFTDPSQKFEMPPDWVKKTIKYEAWAEKADIAITLEQDVYQLILPLIKKFEKAHNLKIEIKEGTCGVSAGMLSRKVVDIAGFCCPPGKEDRLPGVKFHTLGIVSKAFLVHPDNPIDSVTERELTEIFRGRILQWSELKTSKGQPGPEWRIRTIGRFHCQARPGHWRQLLDSDKLFSPRTKEVSSIPIMIAQVAAYKGAIGWEVLDMAEKYANLGKVKPLRINGYAPDDRDAIAARKYPFYRTYNVTTWENKGLKNSNAEKLLEYLMKEVEGIDPKSGFVSSSRLRNAGWKFQGNELIGEPEKR
ncbi:MAG: hypothetical protein EPN94_06775 [Nitrospirae bacterium]|nr:MAG: hypothetical protein EPN94_06775 [Nitrospirota bacterium]